MARKTVAQAHERLDGVENKLDEILAALKAQSQAQAEAHAEKSAGAKARKSSNGAATAKLWGVKLNILSTLAVGDEVTGLSRDDMRSVNKALAGRGSSFAASDWDAEAKVRTYTRRATEAHPKPDGVSFAVSTPNGSVKRLA
jgi:hypothetical protein